MALKEKKEADFSPKGDACCNTSSGRDGQALLVGRGDSSCIPGFYKNPETIDDLIDFVVARILDQLDVEHEVEVDGLERKSVEQKSASIELLTSGARGMRGGIGGVDDGPSGRHPAAGAVQKKCQRWRE